MRYILTLMTVLVAAGLSAGEAYADQQVRDAKKCTTYIPSMERKYGIPSHLLSAIASMESGKYHKDLKIMLPTPWTINVEGQGFYYKTKAQAVAAVKNYQAQGKRSIDVGCMQVNLRHHGHAFSSIEKAFDPKYNVQYAASYLRKLYEEERSWRRAAAAYHSKTPSKGSKYVARIFRAWEKIIARLRLPHQQTIKRADASFDGRDMIQGNARSNPVRITREDRAVPKQHEKVKMKVIEVASVPNYQKSDIILIKPDVSKKSAATAYKKQPNITRVDQQPSSYQSKEDLNIVRLDGQPRSEDGVKIAAADNKPAPKRSSGPRFIFTD